MLVSELISRALRLINEPGRGATLGADDQNDALLALQEILDSESVAKQFIPGITRHFFPMVSGKAIYSYGAGADLDFRSDDFGSLVSGLGDPAPVKIEDAYIREGSQILNNEEVDNFRFEDTSTWNLTGGSVIENNELKIEQAIGTADQAIAGVTQGTIYTLRFKAEVFAGNVTVRCQNNAVDVFSVPVISSGFYSFDFTWTPAVLLPTIEILTDDVGDDIRIDQISLIERGKPRLELPDSQGSDYGVYIVDQRHYNRRFTKGTGGRPYNILYSRAFDERGELRMDNSAVTGDILVMDVLVNRAKILTVQDQVRLNPEATRWLRYALADNIAGEYGKELTMSQQRILRDSWDKLAASNRRQNSLGVDRALRDRPTFDINRGDP